MIKEFLMKQALKQQLKSLPEEQRNAIIAAMEANPTFFEKIAKKIEEKKKSGMGETQAGLTVMREHQNELRQIFMNAAQNKK
jgi:hypothetical protein